MYIAINLGVMLLTLATLISCQNNASISSIKPHQNALRYDSTSIAILDFNNAYSVLPEKSEPYQLQQNDFYSIEHLLKAPVDYANLQMSSLYEDYRKNDPENHPPREWFLIDMKKFKRQYIPYLNKHGEREVLVICFREELLSMSKMNNWKSEPITDRFYGHHAFRLWINLTKAKTGEIRFNGAG